MSARWTPWSTPTRITAAEFIDAAGVLLDAAVDATTRTSSLAGEAVRRTLIEGLAESLSTDGPLAVLHLDTRGFNLGARADLQRQTEQAGRFILERLGDLAGGHAPGDDRFVSHCVGYVWSPGVVQLLIGPTGTHVARNHYNEWLWQMVALRDALIPFARPEAVPILADASGLRRIEPSRDRFVFELSSRRVSFETLLSHAAAVTGAVDPAPAGAYGVSSDGVAVLPAFLIHRRLDSSPWVFDLVEPSPSRRDGYIIGADSDSPDLIEAPSSLSAVTVVSIDGELRAVDDGLVLDVGFDGHRWQVDAGAIATGHRRALRPSGQGTAAAPAVEISGCRVLRSPAPVHSDGEPVVIPTGGQWPLVAALLGRITPGHAVLWRGEETDSLASATAHDGGLVLVDLRG